MSVGICFRRSAHSLSFLASTPLSTTTTTTTTTTSLSLPSSPSHNASLSLLSSCSKKMIFQRQYHPSLSSLSETPLITERGRPNVITFHSSLQKTAEEMNKMREEKGMEETGTVLGGMTETAGHTANIIREMHLLSPFSSSSLALLLSSLTKQWSVSSTSRLLSLVFSSITPSEENNNETKEKTEEKEGEERKIRLLGESLGMCMRFRSRHNAGSLLFHFLNQNCHPSSFSSPQLYLEHLSLLIGSSVARLKFGHERTNDETTVTPQSLVVEDPFWGDEDVGYLLLCLRHDLNQMWKDFNPDFKFDDFDFVCEVVSAIVKESGRERDDRFTEHLINSCLSSWEQNEQNKKIEDIIGRITEKIDRPSRISGIWNYFFGK